MKEYVDLSKLDSGIAIALFFLRHKKEWQAERDKEKIRDQKLYFIGEVLKMPIFSEVTILSMMLGDKTDQTWDVRNEPTKPDSH